MNTTNTLTVTSEHFRDLEGSPVAYLKISTIPDVQTYLSVSDNSDKLEIPNDKYIVLTIQENQLLTEEFIKAMTQTTIIAFVNMKTAQDNYSIACRRSNDYFVRGKNIFRRIQKDGSSWKFYYRSHFGLHSATTICTDNSETLDEYLCAKLASTLNDKIRDQFNNKRASILLEKEQTMLMAQQFLNTSIPLIQNSLANDITVGYIVSNFPRLGDLVDEINKYSVIGISWELGDEGSKTIRWKSHQ